MAEPTLTTVILTRDRLEQVEALASDALLHGSRVLIIDNFSETIGSIKKRHNLRIVRHALNSDFSQQRNFALMQIDTDWTLFVDSDELISSKLWNEIREVIDRDAADAIVFRRLDWFQGKLLQHGEVGRVRLLRCAKTKLGLDRWRRSVHETWDISSARVVAAKTPIEHRPHPTLKEFQAKLHDYAALEPKSRPKYGLGRIIFELFIYPPAKFIQNYFLRRGFFDGWPGLVHAALMSYYSLITRVFLYEAAHTKRS